MAQRTSGIETRKFGIEIECLGPAATGYSQTRAGEAAAEALRAAGLNARFDSYNHTTTRHWKVVTDGSLAGPTAGVEVVSPILSGEEGIEECAQVARVLTAAGFTVNRSCGLHAHVNARDLTPAQIRRAFSAYAVGEMGFDAMVAPSRRGASNRYCQSIPYTAAYRAGCGSVWTQASARQVTEWIAGYATTSSLGAALGTRYCKVNLAALTRHGTIEFRQHHGTTDAAKITNWVRLVVGLVNHAATATREVKVRERPWSAAENRRWFQVRRALRLAGATPEVAAFWVARSNELARAERRERARSNRRRSQRNRRAAQRVAARAADSVAPQPAAAPVALTLAEQIEMEVRASALPGANVPFHVARARALAAGHPPRTADAIAADATRGTVEITIEGSTTPQADEERRVVIGEIAIGNDHGVVGVTRSAVQIRSTGDAHDAGWRDATPEECARINRDLRDALLHRSARD